MKKILTLIGIVLCLSGTASAQGTASRGVFNHLGVNVSAGTEGYGVGLAAPVTDFLEVGFGVNVMPKFNIKGDVKVGYVTVSGIQVPVQDVELNGNLARTTCDLKLNCYPFGGNSKFFVAAGFSFGGSKIAKLEGHSEDVKTTIAKYPELKDLVVAEIDKYKVKFDDNGDIYGDIRVNGFRPYLGLGYGRLVPSKRIGVRVELGCQFQGKMKICQDGQVVDMSEINELDDRLSKLIDKTKVYPVLKLSLTGRIL